VKFADPMPRFAAALALALFCAGLAGVPATAQSGFGPSASVTDLRVGVHPDKTRIVIETDSAAPYVMEPSDDEIVIRVDAASAAEAVTAKSPDLIWVKVEPTRAGTDVRIQLKRPVDVKPMVLKRPDRIVLDLVARSGPAEATPLPAPVVLPEEEPAPVHVAEAEPELVEPEPVVEPVPDETAPVAEPEPARTDEGETDLAVELPEDLGGDVVEPMAEPGSELELAREGAAAEPAAGGHDAPSEVAPEPESPPAGGPSMRTYLLGATAVVLLAVFLWIQRRLRADKKREFPLPDEEDDAPFSPAERAVSVSEEPGSGESVFDVEPDSLRPEPEAVPSLHRTDPEPADEGERRILQLEKRMEELAEAKDRLERQIAAQTEELRVQRAAIARTQRVLRSIAPKDEDGSEPLVRG